MENNNGKKQNLITQIDILKANCNEKSYGTRERYYDATIRFCDFLVDEFNSKKFANISAKHIYAYADYLKQNGKSPSTIRADLSGIRFFYRLSGGKNILPDNSKLDLEKKEVGTVDKAWSKTEIDTAIKVADLMGRTDVSIAIKIGSTFGLRIEEVCISRVEHILNSFKYDDLYVKGKGGQVRFVPVETQQQRELLKKLKDFSKANGLKPNDYLISDSRKHGVEKEIKSIKSWIRNNQHKFIDENRTKSITEGCKPKKETLSFHGLRYYYAQNTQSRLTEEAENDRQKNKVKYEVSERLGHHRGEITKTYLAEK